MALAVKEEPAAAGFPNVIHDELDDSAGTRVSLKESFTTIFTHPLVWFYAAAYACTGAVRHSSDQLSVLFFTQQLGLDMKAKPLAVLIILNLMTTTAILGSILSGWVSDKFFAGHRSPVARFLYLLEAGVIALAALMMFSGLIKPGLLGVTLAGIFLVLVSLTVNSTHSVVGAAAPMDIGGKKMAGFAAGVIDSFQYYGSAVCLFITGILIKKFGWASWYPVMILFALGGALAMHHVRKVQLHHKNSPDGDPRIKNS
jgi:sugar phosphate permease